MGITGLLPALKAIHKTKHISEYSGKTVAVDAYAWLHRGVHACATELAMNVTTIKYVSYVMERVRFLRHNGVEPYIVFDGGPLPAKKETEISRKARREENMARGKSLQAMGKPSQAREFFAKCVDVTPQMAYQCIKALMAENVKFVVAPYEADAQMAYLERVGLVDAIVTEDSDLLVFGCKTVLYKLDVAHSTVVSISRSDFSSVHSDGITLTNWSDKQFRTMAILSGCDYLTSIPGIGLKTACSLLRRWKTVEQVVRAVTLEGKKSVPPGYLDNFKMAEMCFLHQRVYCPELERLVHLTEIQGEWDSALDAHVGPDLEPAVAKQLALGRLDPITLLPMDDINPSYSPKRAKELSLQTLNKGKGKAKEASGGIRDFFGPNPIIPQTPKSPTKKGLMVERRMVVGKASGKRTLADAMDEDVRCKKPRASEPGQLTVSKFFASPRRKSLPTSPVAGPSRLRGEKENIPIADDVDDDYSVMVQGNVEPQMELDVDEILTAQEHIVDQEEGYISPTPSQSHDTDDLSSPVRPSASRSASLDDNDFGADPISSPVAPRPMQSRSFPAQRLFLDVTPSNLVDLRKTLAAEDIDSSDSEASGADSATPPSLTPPDVRRDDEDEVEEEDVIARGQDARQAAVAQGWRMKYAYPLQRSNTNVTPAGRQRVVKNSRASPYPLTTPQSAPKSLIFVDTLKKSTKPRHSSPCVTAEEAAKARLGRFRFK